MSSDLEIGSIGIEVTSSAPTRTRLRRPASCAGKPTGIGEITWTADEAVHVMILEYETR